MLIELGKFLVIKPTVVKATCADFEVWVDQKLVISKQGLGRLPLVKEVVVAVKKEIRHP